MKTMTWILGADDPEMAAIDELLYVASQSIVYATKEGRIVHGGNAYHADVPNANLNKTITVECGGDWRPLANCDHHRPGDIGYGDPPAGFMEGSSLGQVIRRLIHLGFVPEWELISGPSRRVYGEIRFIRGQWCVATGEMVDDATEMWFVIPKEYVVTAAADHCLGAAYAGECPGVDVDVLGEWRVAGRAAFQRRPAEDVRADIDAAMKKVEAVYAANHTQIAGCVQCGTLGHDDCHYGYDGIPPLVADMRGVIIPELPEAACRLGIPVLAGPLKTPDGRSKVVLQAATPRVIRKFLAGEIAPSLVDRYGSPERGYAGGYEPTE